MPPHYQNLRGALAYPSPSFVMMAQTLFMIYLNQTRDTHMQKPKASQIALLLQEPVNGSLKTFPNDARDASTEERSQVQFNLQESLNQPLRQIKRTQFGKSRIPKKFLISQTS